VQRPTRDQILKQLLPESRTVFDIGANVGQSARSFRALWPEATIHCFEPDPRNLQELQESADHGMVVNRVAVSDTETAASDFHLSSAAQASGISAPSTEYLRRGVTEVDMVQVPTTTIDAYCRAHEISRIDFCKVDTQGHTAHCLDGPARPSRQGRSASCSSSCSSPRTTSTGTRSSSSSSDSCRTATRCTRWWTRTPTRSA
jgi:FkbM family methyltransferase